MDTYDPVRLDYFGDRGDHLIIRAHKRDLGGLGNNSNSGFFSTNRKMKRMRPTPDSEEDERKLLGEGSKDGHRGNKGEGRP